MHCSWLFMDKKIISDLQLIYAFITLLFCHEIHLQILTSNPLLSPAPRHVPPLAIRFSTLPAISSRIGSPSIVVSGWTTLVLELHEENIFQRKHILGNAMYIYHNFSNTLEPS
jgi:hypothetical protein